MALYSAAPMQHPTTVETTSIPAHSRVQALLANASFHDCYRVLLADTDSSALQHFLRAAAHTPPWVERLMQLRNRSVALFGLKNLGALHAVDTHKPEASYRPGERVGIFTLRSISTDEVVLGDHDHHLDVAVSVLRLPLTPEGQRPLAVSTVVKTHNLLGRLYMLPVAPLHRRIVPAVLRGLQAQAA
jgi:hypothetical protein